MSLSDRLGDFPVNADTKRILLRWEKWRIGYSLILLVESVWLLWEHLAVALADWRLMVLFAVAANVCFCLGPFIEIRARAYWSPRIDRTRAGWFLAGLLHFLFWAGLAFSMLLVYIVAIQGSEYLAGTSDSPHPYF